MLLLLACGDKDPGDSGAPGAGGGETADSGDAGASDTGGSDGAGGDTGGSDGGGGDTGSSDGAGGDTGDSDTGGSDAGDTGDPVEPTGSIADDAELTWLLPTMRLEQGRLGDVVVPVGDVDGDGYDDVGIGDLYACSSGTCNNGGRAWICSGADVGDVYLDACMGRVEGITPDGHYGNPGTQAGAAIARAGDLDGDGYDDVYVSAPGWDHSETEPGLVGVLFGPVAGVTPTTRLDVALEGPWGGSGFGASLVSTGDTDGDGGIDLIVGNGVERGYTAEGVSDPSWYGELWIFDGRPSTGGEVTDHDGLRATITLGLGAHPSELAACDVDGDGLADLWAGDDRANRSSYDEGMAVLFTAPHVDGSTLDDAHLVLWGDDPGGGLGSRVRCAGDQDGDGLSDLAVAAASRDSAEFSGAGAVAVLTGETTAAGGTLELDEADGRVEGGRDWQELGFGLDVLSPAEEGGPSRLVVGAPGSGLEHENQGAVYVFEGMEGAVALADAAGSLRGDAAWQRLGSSVVELGDIDADGEVEVAVAVDGNTPYGGDGWDHRGAVYVHPAAGLPW